MDIAASGLAEVKRRAGRLGLAEKVSVAEGSFEALPLGDGAVEAVMSIDALLFTPSKEAAARELARVLRPGGRLVLTTWDYHRQPEGRPPQVPDHRPILDAAGFAVLAYEDNPDWDRTIRQLNALLMDSVVELAKEREISVEEMRAAIAEMAASADAMIRRVLVVAERR